MAASPIITTIIGSGAVRAHPTRGGASFLVQHAGRNLLFDCGRLAVHNLARFGVPVEKIDAVYITHLHFDHICDLPLLLLLSWNNGRKEHLPVCGPKGIAAFLEHGVRQAYAADIESRMKHSKKQIDGLLWEVTELSAEDVVSETDGMRIDTLITKHAGLLNFNFRLTAPGRKIVIMSDSEPDPRIVEFCRDADLMLVECSGTKEFYATQAWGGWHMTPEDIGRITAEAGVKKVVLKHLVIENFSPDPDISEKMAATVRSLHPTGEVVVAADGLRFEL
jgi:ribonuclease Z